jgi:hypothetical protein
MVGWFEMKTSHECVEASEFAPWTQHSSSLGLVKNYDIDHSSQMWNDEDWLTELKRNIK